MDGEALMCHRCVQNCRVCVQGMADGSAEQLALTASLHDRRARAAEAQTPPEEDSPAPDSLGDSPTGSPQLSNVLQHLHVALTARQQLVRATQGDFRDVQEDARMQAASTALRIARMYCAEQRLQEARQVCANTLTACAGHAELTLEVARLDLCLGDADSCEQLVRYCAAAATPNPSLHSTLPASICPFTSENGGREQQPLKTRWARNLKQPHSLEWTASIHFE